MSNPLHWPIAGLLYTIMYNATGAVSTVAKPGR